MLFLSFLFAFLLLLNKLFDFISIASDEGVDLFDIFGSLKSKSLILFNFLNIEERYIMTGFSGILFFTCASDSSFEFVKHKTNYQNES